MASDLGKLIVCLLCSRDRLTKERDAALARAEAAEKERDEAKDQLDTTKHNVETVTKRPCDSGVSNAVFSLCLLYETEKAARESAEAQVRELRGVLEDLYTEIRGRFAVDGGEQDMSPDLRRVMTSASAALANTKGESHAE